MTGEGGTIRDQMRDFWRILADVRGLGPRVRLVLHLAGSRLRRPASGKTVRVPFRAFEAEFEIAQGEIAPYAQMLKDVDSEIIAGLPEVRSWTVIDCGANVGLFSLFLKDARRIVAIEPNPSANQRLRRNLEMNRVPATVIEAAVSDCDGTTMMDFANSPSVLATIGDNGTTVRSICLDTLLAEQGIDSVDLLKLDVEGHEIEALRGAEDALKRGAIARIVAEHNNGSTLVDLDEHLAEFGYKRIVTGHVNARFELRKQAT